MTTKTRKRLAAITVGVLTYVGGAETALLQTRTYPKEIRGYKVERTVVEVKKPEAKNRQTSKDQNERGDKNSDGQRNADPNSEGDVDELIQLGNRNSRGLRRWELPLKFLSSSQQSNKVGTSTFSSSRTWWSTARQSTLTNTIKRSICPIRSE